MKKLISFLLVIMLLSSISVSAFATDDTKMGVSAGRDRFNTEDSEEGSVSTDLWLQVDASGQIDVTVPMVLVFRTNIDGGTATSPTNYALTNRSTADLVVTKIETATDATVDASTANPMSLVEYGANLGEDEYKVKLSVPTGVVIGNNADNVELSNGWDLSTRTHENDKIRGGLFELAQPADGAESKSTRVITDMSTGKLSFITSRAVDADGNDAGMDVEMGVKLLTISYTVAIDTSDAIGVDVEHTKATPDDETDDTDITVANITSWAQGTDN